MFIRRIITFKLHKVNVKQNHPWGVFNQENIIPKDQKSFKRAKENNQKGLFKVSYKHELKCISSSEKNTKRKKPWYTSCNILYVSKNKR